MPNEMDEFELVGDAAATGAAATGSAATGSAATGAVDRLAPVDHDLADAVRGITSGMSNQEILTSSVSVSDIERTWGMRPRHKTAGPVAAPESRGSDASSFVQPPAQDITPPAVRGQPPASEQPPPRHRRASRSR